MSNKYTNFENKTFIYHNLLYINFIPFKYSPSIAMHLSQLIPSPEKFSSSAACFKLYGVCRPSAALSWPFCILGIWKYHSGLNLENMRGGQVLWSNFGPGNHRPAETFCSESKALGNFCTQHLNIFNPKFSLKIVCTDDFPIFSILTNIRTVILWSECTRDCTLLSV